MFPSSAPSTNGAAITPSDSTLLTGTRAVWVGGAGDLIVDFNDATNVPFRGIAAGTLLPIAPIRIKAATTASNVTVLY